MKKRYYWNNPVALLCFLLGHERDPDLEHGFCHENSSQFCFCKRCTFMYRQDKETGEWLGEDEFMRDNDPS